jgi:hypothetical protein
MRQLTRVGATSPRYKKYRSSSKPPPDDGFAHRHDKTVLLSMGAKAGMLQELGWQRPKGRAHAVYQRVSDGSHEISRLRQCLRRRLHQQSDSLCAIQVLPELGWKGSKRGAPAVHHCLSRRRSNQVQKLRHDLRCRLQHQSRKMQRPRTVTAPAGRPARMLDDW